MAVITRILSCLILGVSLSACVQEDNPHKVHVYNWAENLEPSLLEDFEKETGITVVYDVYESNDVLEAKLLTGNSGYDVVFPSLYPYFARQRQAGVYTKLDKSKIPNLRLLDSTLVQLLDKVPHGSDYAIPYVWSLTVIAYRADLVERYFPNAPVDSLRMLYDPEVVKALSRCGVGYLEESVDVIPMTLHYLGYPPDSSDPKQIDEAVNHLLKIRPYISQMGTIRPVEDLVTGDSCVAQNWLSYVSMVQERIKSMKSPPDIRFSIPKEGTSMWLDVIAIPVDAPHKENAYKFIDFLLRPENMAKVTNKLYYYNSIPASEPYISEEARTILKLDPAVRKKLFHTQVVTKDHMKKLTKAIQRVVSGR